jgi:hypothetical protein
MTPAESLTYWDPESSNESCFQEDGNLKYDVIPVKKDGQISGFITNDRPDEIKQLERKRLITHDSPISELVSLFLETLLPALFVISRQEIVGLVTPADLNKLPTRIYIYSLIGEVELQLSNLIRQERRITPEEILSLISKDRSYDVRSLMETLDDQNVDIDIYQLLYLSDMLSIIQKTKVLREGLGFSSRKEAEHGLSGINDLRSQTMHLVKPLLSKMPKDLHTLDTRLARIRHVLDI